MKMCSAILALALSALAQPVFAQEPGVDAEECQGKASKLLTRMPGCGLYECSRKDYDAADVVVNMAGETKSLEGELEILQFVCPSTLSPLQLARNAEAALKKAGYTVGLAGRADGYDFPIATGHKGAQWIMVETGMFNEFAWYKQTAVLVKEMAQEMTASAQAMAEAIAA
jgi:hypothetical protein